jgi:hypothetical protein
MLLDGKREGPYLSGRTLTPFPVAASRRSGTNNGMNTPPTTIPALLRSNGTGTKGERGQEVATAATTQREGYRHDKRESSAPGKAGYGVCLHHTTHPVPSAG